MENKFKSNEAFLIDALEYYLVDPESRRCLDDDKGICCYHPKQAGKINKSEGCLIGRHLIPENALKLDELGTMTFFSALSKHSKLLPDWIKNMNSGFLSSCQQLHDDGDYWSLADKKLSPNGKQKLSSIIELYKLDKTQFEKYLN